ncbi:HD domain-containing protein [Lentzea kentuckyensis]|uniref:wHTH domain-containing protein n=1 Tax=Lentzea kentuckyensis TaxID=360086 RepID=UPI000A3AA6F9|nr:hypothetical protein [Lentzea kentuckyensis]
MPDSDLPPPIDASGPRRSFGDATAPHPWSIAAGNHLGQSNEMRADTLAVVRKLADEWEDSRALLVRDPWLDTEFAARFTKRVQWSAGRLPAQDKPTFSDAESALLITFPYLHQAFWARQAASTLAGADPAVLAFTGDRTVPGFSTFAANQGMLHRRGTRAFEAGDPAADGIAWWLFHQWLVNYSNCYHAVNIAALLPEDPEEPLRSVLTPARLMELMRVVQIAPAFLTQSDRLDGLRPVAHIEGGSEIEQEIREQLLGHLLVLAHRMAIDPAVLHRAVADHLGIDDGVTPAEVLRSLRNVTWSGTRTRVLTAECSHAATAFALREQAAVVDSVLTDIVVASEEPGRLQPLGALPVHATADGITLAASTDDNRHPSVALGHRFRLSDHRVQELLIGDQLYGTPELAIRELYQNALDACRYRGARTDYLVKTRHEVEPWTGRIGFRQDVDERGRPFLECADNGIGMGERELVDVFSQAGVRFTDLPEYVEEQADWAAVGIESYPNSRFGIGVLSYFMLADEVTVTTCRLSRGGGPGRRLEMHIAGPGALFRVRDVGQGREAGTVVRLWLRRTGIPVHCTELLRRILWVSDYLVTSDDLSGRHTWEPGQLSPMAPIGSDALAPDARRTADRVVTAEFGLIWWCDTNGAVLSDGIWAGTRLFGAIVNLTRNALPRLTVDRKTIIDLDRSAVEDRLRAATEALLRDPADSPLSHSWLSTLVDDMPRLADEICERAIEARYRPWLIAGREMPIEIVGCFPEDEQTLSTGRMNLRDLNDHIGAWRLAAWLHANPELAPWAAPDTTVVPALPSDGIILSESADGGLGRPWLDTFAPPDLGHVLSAALRAHRSPTEVAERLRELGRPVPDGVQLPGDVEATDSLLLSGHYPGKPPWLRTDKPVRHDQVLVAAINSGLTPHAAAQRLIDLGYDVPTFAQLPAVVHPVDKALVSFDVATARRPLGETVPVAHIMSVAAKAARTPAEVARRLRELGYATPSPEELPLDHDPQDETVFAELTMRPFSRAPDPVPLRYITTTALKSGRSPARIAARLAQVGFAVPSETTLPESVTSTDHVLVREYNLAEPSSDWVRLNETVEIGDVLSAALKTDTSPADVARRLTALGFTPPPLDLLPDETDVNDLVLVSTSIGRDRGVVYERNAWLKTGQRVHPQHVLIAAAKTRQAPRNVARRLAEMGFDTPADDLFRSGVGGDEVVLLSVFLDGKPPWLLPDHPALARTGLTLPLGHVLAGAAQLGRSPAEVAERITRLGLRVEEAEVPQRIDPIDAQLLNRAVETSSWAIFHQTEFPWLSATASPGRLHLLIAASRTGFPPADVARRLAALDIPVETAHLPAAVDKNDLILLSKDLRGEERFRSLDDPFPRGQVLSAARQTRTTPGEVLERIRALGFTLSE